MRGLGFDEERRLAIYTCSRSFTMCCAPILVQTRSNKRVPCFFTGKMHVVQSGGKERKWVIAQVVCTCKDRDHFTMPSYWFCSSSDSGYYVDSRLNTWEIVASRMSGGDGIKFSYAWWNSSSRISWTQVLLLLHSFFLFWLSSNGQKSIQTSCIRHWCWHPSRTTLR